MTKLRAIAWAILVLVISAAVFADWLAPASYAAQFRDAPKAPPSRRFPLGTDELGRDRLSRLLYGTRVSLLLAPAAALLSTVIAAMVGGIAGYAGGWCERLVMRGADLFLSLPWLFLFLIVRALLPLNVSPVMSISMTFLLMGLLAWPGPARAVRAGVHSLLASEFLLQARSSGCHGLRLVAIHILPNLAPILRAQFWIAIPAFIVAEANLGLLGLGVAEPLPSWGNLLRGLENYSLLLEHPWALAPLVLLVTVLSCLQVVFPKEELP